MEKNGTTEKMTAGVDMDDLMFIDDFDDIIEMVEKAEKPASKAPHTTKTGTVNSARKASSQTATAKRTPSSSARTAQASRTAQSAHTTHASHGTKKGNGTVRASSKKKSRKKGVASFFYNLSGKEKMILAGGLAVIVLFVAVGSVAVRAHARTAAVRSFAGVGARYSAEAVIGSDGLLAADHAAQAASMVIAETEEHDEEVRSVDIEMVVQTIKADLKIKFVDQETGTVAKGIAFGAQVTDPDGKDETHYDTDKDGIIYLDGLAGGAYHIEFVPPKNDKDGIYKNAKVTSRTVTVSETVTMAAVDVSDEVVDEAAAGPAGEAGDITPVESVPQDTVAWVESTKTPIGVGGVAYQKINKNTIKNPAMARGLSFSDFQYLEGDIKDKEDNGSLIVPKDPIEIQVDGSVTPDISAAPENGTWKLEISQGSEYVSISDRTIVGKAEGTAIITVSFSYTYEKEIEYVDDESGETKTRTDTIAKTIYQTIQVDVKAKPAPQAEVSIRFTTSDMTLAINQKGKLGVEVTPAGGYTFEVGNTNIVEVDANGNVTGKAAGSTKVTVRSTENKNKTAECSITVTPYDYNGTLKDTAGNVVYILNNGEYKIATNADYDKYDDFYIQVQTAAQYRYTGWQTIDGKTYYYDANGNYVTGQQVIRGVQYNFDGNGVLSMSASNVGIDVSAHQGVIDWNAVKSAGVSFAIIRCGFRGYETGRLAEDSYYRRNIQGAINAGIKVGIYVYSSAVNDVEAVEEASFAISLARGYGLALPIFIDVENPGNGRARNISADTRTAVIKAFCGTVQNSGYRAGVYSNTTWFNSMINTPQLTGYTIWLAQYNDRPTYTRTKFDLWQYSSKGRIPGINTNVDMNYSYINF